MLSHDDGKVNLTIQSLRCEDVLQIQILKVRGVAELHCFVSWTQKSSGCGFMTTWDTYYIILYYKYVWKIAAAGWTWQNSYVARSIWTPGCQMLNLLQGFPLSPVPRGTKLGKHFYMKQEKSFPQRTLLFKISLFPLLEITRPVRTEPHRQGRLQTFTLDRESK